MLQCPLYIMVPVTVTTYWYDNYGLAVLQQIQDLMWSWRFLGLFILGISSLITAMTSVSVAAISLTQPVHTAQCVDTMSNNVSLTLATQEFIDRKLEMRVSSVQFSSVTQSCLTLYDPMNHSTPGLPVHHHLPEFTQTHVQRVRDAIQPSRPRSSPSPPAPNPSQHQSFFQWVNSSHEVAIILEFQL